MIYCLSIYAQQMALRSIQKRAANKATRQALIEEAKDKMELQKNKPYESHLAELVLSMACVQGFKADYFQA